MSRRLVFTRESYIPKGAIKIIDKQSDAVVYINDLNGVPYGIGFAGKANKPSFNYRFRSAEHREKHTRQFFAGRQAHVRMIAERRAARQSFDAREHFSKGDVVYNSWGYDQTNVDFYVVEEVTQKFVTLNPCGSRLTEDGATAQSGHVVPVPEFTTGKLIKRTAYSFGSSPTVNFRYGAGGKWDGRPKFTSWYA